MALPNDPFMLLSVVNTKLRDEYGTLDELCASEEVDKTALTQRLHQAGFDYMPQINQFR